MPSFVLKVGKQETNIEMHDSPNKGDDLNFNVGGVFVVDRIEHEFYNVTQPGTEIRQRRTIVHATKKPTTVGA